jgi:tRNA(fMet)-specific endonuclease VapC
MTLLDTDHMTFLLSGGAEGARLRARLRAIPPDEAATTIISYEEQTRGWLARIAQERSVEGQIPVYGRLKRQLQLYCSIAVVDFDERAAAEFQRLRRARIRIGTMDLKIAAIALVNHATLLTRNLTDFGKVPDLRVEDWTL